jgi:hypothetical protein
VRLGTTVIVLPYRHPLLVARMARNLDELSGGAHRRGHPLEDSIVITPLVVP